MHNWFWARETALARVRALRTASPGAKAGFFAVLTAMIDNVGNWRTADLRQHTAIAGLAVDLATLARETPAILDRSPLPWDALYRFAETHFSLEGQEASVALLLEPQGELVDELAEKMSADEGAAFRIDGGMSCDALKVLIASHYAGRADMTLAGNPRMRVSGTSPKKSSSRAWASAFASPAPNASNLSRSPAT